jgi:hypothetical protein
MLGRATTPAWDSNPLDSAQVIEIVEIPTTFDRRSAGRMQPVKEDRTPQLAAAEELGMLRSDWLGVRDDFRNWFVENAA